MTKNTSRPVADRTSGCQSPDDLTCVEEVRRGLMDLFAAIDEDPAAQAAPDGLDESDPDT